MSEIKVTNLNFSYIEGQKVLDGVSFSTEKGQYVSILGHNGSGKSTLARLLIGLLKKDSGEIEIQGLVLSKETVREIRKKVAIVFQNPDNQFIGATVEDDVAFGLENRCVPQKDMQGIIDYFLKEVGMEQYAKKEPSMLSGGQKQRVAIAGALALSPDIIIFDEATSMLDPHGKREIASLIRKMREKNSDLTVISITHDVEEAFLSDEVIVLNHGSIALKGKPEIVLNDKQKLESLHLAMPLILEIKQKLAAEGIKVKCENDINSLVEALCPLK